MSILHKFKKFYIKKNFINFLIKNQNISSFFKNYTLKFKITIIK